MPDKVVKPDDLDRVEGRGDQVVGAEVELVELRAPLVVQAIGFLGAEAVESVEGRLRCRGQRGAVYDDIQLLTGRKQTPGVVERRRGNRRRIGGDDLDAVARERDLSDRCSMECGFISTVEVEGIEAVCRVRGVHPPIEVIRPPFPRSRAAGGTAAAWCCSSGSSRADPARRRSAHPSCRRRDSRLPRSPPRRQRALFGGPAR